MAEVAQRGNRSEQRRGRGCFSCGEEGHLARDCPQRADAPRDKQAAGGVRREFGVHRDANASESNTQQRKPSRGNSGAEQRSAGNGTRSHDGKGRRGGRGGRRGGRGAANRTDDDRAPAAAAYEDEDYGSDSAASDDKAAKDDAPQRRGGMTKLKLVRGGNTETFKPSHEPTAMRIVIDPHPTRLSVRLGVRDMLYVPSMFSQPGDERLYERILDEVQSCGVPPERLLKSWHGDSHLIADDKTNFKNKCPLFLSVVQRMRDYFNMDVKATRFNWYRNTAEWKPFHHDAAAVKPQFARTQNFTVAASFGATRDAAFEHAETRCTLSLPCPNGSVYCFSRDTNILFRHGILQDKVVREEGRISIILWGWVDQAEVEDL